MKVKVFPKIELNFKLIDKEDVTLARLKRRTKHSETLTSQYTDKSFIGKVEGTKFRIISSSIGKGAFCVMTGETSSNEGHVKVEIHTGFKVLLSIFLSFPIVGITIEALSGSETFWTILIPVAIAQMFVIRFMFIGLVFKILAKSSLNRLRDVMDFEWKN